MNLGTWAFADFLCLHVFWLLFVRFLYCIITELGEKVGMLSLFNGTEAFMILSVWFGLECIYKAGM